MDRGHALPRAALDGTRESDRVRMAGRGRQRPTTTVLPHSQGRSQGAAIRTTTVDRRPHNPDETMESQTPFDLSAAIQRWRAELAQFSSFRPDDLDELESHLRDSESALELQGLTAEE